MTLAVQTPRGTAMAGDGDRSCLLHLVKANPRATLWAAALAGRRRICQQQFPSALYGIPGTYFLLRFFGSCRFRAASSQVLLITPPVN